MPFISYAQNLEDVMLFRALHGVAKGFYIDVGASDPHVDSVTKAFYERGWRGINIEPMRQYYERLRAERPDDTNLHLAVGESEAVLPYYEIPDTGLSTLDPGIAERCRAEGKPVVESMIEVLPLASVCECHVRGDIHFLKIDVEGTERAVLLGMDFCRYRPWVMVVEATLPNTRVENHAQWEDILLGQGYRFVYFDGLNRFYLDEGRKELLQRFAAPPSCFDDYVRYTEVALRESLSRTEAQRDEAVVRLREREAQRDEAVVRLREREAQLVALYRSRSWRVTAPMRAVGRALRGLRRRVPRPRTKTVFIECTHTVHSDLNTGIQRVVRNIVQNAAAAAAPFGYDVIPVVAENGTFVPVDVARVVADKHRVEATGSTPSVAPAVPTPAPVPFRQKALRVLRPPWHLLRRIIGAVLPFPAVHQFLWAPRSQFGLARIGLFPWRAARAVLGVANLGARRGSAPPDSPNLDWYASLQDSVLLLLDSSWTIPLWPAVERFKTRGGRVVGVIYDLVPVTHAYTSVPHLTAAFRAWLEGHFRLTDGFIAISRSVADQIRAFIESSGGPEAPVRQVPVGHFHLGCNLDLIESHDVVRDAVSEIFRVPRHVFLMVGSLEPRKNHAFVLDAFDAFWASGGTGVLMIVGRQDWKVDDFLKRVKGHPEKGRQLLLLRDLSDRELDHAYRNASCLLIASVIEGFGLPIVEAFQRGLPVMCSDIPVFREIADGRALFFDLADAGCLVACLREFCRANAPGASPERRPQPWLSWRESAEQLFQEMQHVLEPGERRSRSCAS
jgi:FkbM family methyltransferase